LWKVKKKKKGEKGKIFSSHLGRGRGRGKSLPTFEEEKKELKQSMEKKGKGPFYLYKEKGGKGSFLST